MAKRKKSWRVPSLKDRYERAFQDVGDLAFDPKKKTCRIRGGPTGRRGYSEKVSCNSVIVAGDATGLIFSDSKESLFTFKGGTLCLLGRKKNTVECGLSRKYKRTGQY